MNPVLKKYHCRDAEDISCSFEYKGRIFDCTLSGVSGRGSEHSYDVMIIPNGWGTLLLSNETWLFISRKGSFDEIGEQLGKVIEQYWGMVDMKNPA